MNSVHPDFVETPFVKDLKGTPQDKWIIDNTPMGRYAQPEEVAAGIAFLASDDSTYVTGLELYIDGGFIAKQVVSSHLPHPSPPPPEGGAHTTKPLTITVFAR